MGTEALRFLLMFFAGWGHRGQLEAIDYLKEEHRVLREQIGGRRLRFTNEQRRRLETKGRRHLTCAFKVRDQWRFRRADIDAWIDKQVHSEPPDGERDE